MAITAITVAALGCETVSSDRELPADAATDPTLVLDVESDSRITNAGTGTDGGRDAAGDRPSASQDAGDIVHPQFEHVPVPPGRMDFSWFPAAKERYASAQPDDPMDWSAAYEKASTIRTVGSCDDLKAELGRVDPGDMVLVEPRVYESCRVAITRPGDPGNPIIVTSKAKALGESGEVVFRGGDRFAQFANTARHYVIGGFRFESQTTETIDLRAGSVSGTTYGDGATDIRITDSWFEDIGRKRGSNNAVIHVGERCHRVRVDHNVFIHNYNHVRYRHGKDSLVSATKDGRIDHNYFGPAATTGFLDGKAEDGSPDPDEPVVPYEIGAMQTCCWHISETSDPLTLTVELNVIEMPGGRYIDPELMEIKTNGAIIRNNIIWREGGSISLRYSHHSTVESNYLVGAGVSLHGSDHRIVGNHIDGDSRIKHGILMLRWGRRKPENCTDMPPTHHNLIADNMIINTKVYGLRIGDGDYGARRPITDMLITRNRIESESGTLAHFNTKDEPGRLEDEPKGTKACNATTVARNPNGTERTFMYDKEGDADGGRNERVAFVGNIYVKRGAATFGNAYQLDDEAVVE